MGTKEGQLVKRVLLTGARLVFSLLILSSFFPIPIIQAQTAPPDVVGPGGTTLTTVTPYTSRFTNPLTFSTVNDLLTRILGFLQGFIVTIAIIFIVIGGFLYITSAGNDGRMETAKNCVLAALIGLALGIAAPAFLKEIYTILGTDTTIPAGVGTTLSLLQIASNVLSFLLTIIGILAIIMLVIGGIMYLMAAGNEDQIDRGKKIVKYSIIGILIALASLVLVKQVAGFFSDSLGGATAPNNSIPSPEGPANGGAGGGGNSPIVLAPGDYTYTFETADGQRSYVVHVPIGYDGTKALPVLLHLHGGMGTAASGNLSTGFSSLADSREFIVVYGQGTTGSAGFTSWNAGGCCGSSQEKNNDIDDVAYVGTVLAQVQEKLEVDTARIYVSGMSNGSMLANRLACEVPHLIAGVATVSGTTQVSVCNPSRAIPHIIIHGTIDTNVPYAGGKSGSPFNSGTFPAVEDEFKTWSTRNGCNVMALSTSVVASEVSDGTSADRLTYASCPEGKEVVLYRINNGGHSWPGGTTGSNDLEGQPSQAIDASQTILNFFGL